MGSSHCPDEAFITSIAHSIADQRDASEYTEALLAQTRRELATRSLATSETIHATDATLEAEASQAMVESLQSEIARLRAQVPEAPAFDPSSVASSSWDTWERCSSFAMRSSPFYDPPAIRRVRALLPHLLLLSLHPVLRARRFLPQLWSHLRGPLQSPPSSLTLPRLRR